MSPLGFTDYLRAAFLNRWNLLYLFGVLGLTMLTPAYPDAVLALGVAGEAALMATLVGNERFRRLVNSSVNAAEDRRSAEEVTQRFNALYAGLDRESRTRFDALKKRCEVLRGVDIGEDDLKSFDKIAENQLQGVNKLLWVYLKLLHTHGALLQFLANTDAREISALEEAAKARLKDIPENSDNPNDDKKRKSLEDTLVSAKLRSDNLKRAKDNLEYVQLELARIASKVTALAEMTVSRHNPDAITNQVDDAARSVETTEQAIGELRMFNGLTAEDVQAPRILQPPTPRVRA